MTLKVPLGPVVADVIGLQLNEEDVARLRHPLVGAVILFARNYASPEQLKRLTASIRALREPALLIAVDHEGGRVQRFRAGFTAIPSMRTFGELWQRSEADALKAALDCGYIMGAELAAHGIDFSFAPVLDLDWGESGVIGNRAFHRQPHIVAALAGALMRGLREAGMANCGKHFPGHGYVRADSHHDIARDERRLGAISAQDLVPFQMLAEELDSVMPAHVIYAQIDAQPAGFSKIWLQQVLRVQLGFKGLIFSDDLSMEGASVAGGVVARAEAALDAGCDMVLLCNDPPRCDELLSGLAARGAIAGSGLAGRLQRMRAGGRTSDLATDPRYQAARASVAGVGLD
ncbi:MAG TPA: beta-N-acetylhexosaminidase [Usitatibacteraceae bacterium]